MENINKDQNKNISRIYDLTFQNFGEKKIKKI